MRARPVSHSIATTLFSLAASLFVAEAALAQKAAPQPLLDELMVKSGLNKQLGELQASVLAGIDEATQASSAPMAPANVTRLKQAFAKSYAPDRIRAGMREQMGNALTLPEQREILAFLNSALGVRMTQLDEQYSTVTEHSKAAVAAPDHFKQLPPERVKRIQRLVQSLRADEGMSNVIINNQIALISGLSLATPGAKPVDIAAIRQKMDAERPRLVTTLSQQLAQLYGYIYRELSDADLNQFDVFATSPAGRKYHNASIQGLDKVMAQASLAAGFDLGGDRLRTEPKPVRP